MKLRIRNFFIVTLIFAALLSGGLRPAYACGPFSKYVIFSYSKHPDLPLDKFSRGELGILQQTYARSYLYVAYRLMNGGSFSQQEQQALTKLWQERLDFNQGEQENSTNAWLDARKKIPGVKGDPQIEVYRAESGYDYFLNCPSDAFKNAAKTLEERKTKFGVDSAELKEWIQAQDQVFSNCGSGKNIPDKAVSSAPVIQADRAYQIAAANFYATNFDEAKQQFESISNDAASPWREQAKYLVARSLLRKASLGEETQKEETLLQAEAQLKKTLSETTQAELRSSAGKLLNLVGLRLRPAELVRGLSQTLLKQEANENLYQDLWDYTILLDKYLGDSDQLLDEKLKKSLDAAGKDDLTDWLITFQAETKDSLSHSLEKWEQTNATTWLIASLSKVSADHTKAASLMSAAERVAQTSPAHATAQFHLIRLLLEKGDRVGAKSRLDTLLEKQSALPASAANRFRHQRMLLASDLEDFLKYAQRQPAAFSWDDDGRENPADVSDDEELKIWAGRAMLDVDASRIMNEQFPLSMLREAATSRSLPEHIRRQIALAAWTRAAILDDFENGKALAPLAVAHAPELKSYLDDYLTAKTPAERKSAAIYTILTFPGLRPYVESNTGRTTPLSERDSYRDNWWCEDITVSSPTLSETEDTTEPTEKSEPLVRQAESSTIGFLGDSQREMAKRERTQLVSLGAAPNYLAREVIAWATRTPNDPLVPQALHLAVYSTRYGCTNKESGKWSKEAFQLLQKRYPKSPWAKKTPYWFNQG